MLKLGNEENLDEIYEITHILAQVLQACQLVPHSMKFKNFVRISQAA